MPDRELDRTLGDYRLLVQNQAAQINRLRADLAAADLAITVGEEHTQHWERRAIAAEADLADARRNIAAIPAVIRTAQREIEREDLTPDRVVRLMTLARCLDLIAPYTRSAGGGGPAEGGGGE